MPFLGAIGWLSLVAVGTAGLQCCMFTILHSICDHPRRQRISHDSHAWLQKDKNVESRCTTIQSCKAATLSQRPLHLRPALALTWTQFFASLQEAAIIGTIEDFMWLKLHTVQYSQAAAPAGSSRFSPPPSSSQLAQAYTISMLQASFVDDITAGQVAR